MNWKERERERERHEKDKLVSLNLVFVEKTLLVITLFSKTDAWNQTKNLTPASSIVCVCVSVCVYVYVYVCVYVVCVCAVVVRKGECIFLKLYLSVLLLVMTKCIFLNVYMSMWFRVCARVLLLY